MSNKKQNNNDDEYHDNNHIPSKLAQGSAENLHSLDEA